MGYAGAQDIDVSEIPVIDLGPLRDGSATGVRTVAAEVDDRNLGDVGNMQKADIDALRAADAGDGEILEVNQVCAYFNYSNRLLNGLGVTTEGDSIGYYD